MKATGRIYIEEAEFVMRRRRENIIPIRVNRGNLSTLEWRQQKAFNSIKKRQSTFP